MPIIDAPSPDETDEDLDELETSAEEHETDEPDPDGADQLGDAGTRALAAMKAKLKAEKAARRALQEQLDARNAPAPDDADAIRADAERAATARANTRVLRSEIKAAAGGRLATPDDALRFIDLGQFEADANGDFDQDEIREAIDDLLERSPYLAAQGQRRHGDGGNGPRGAKPPKQYSREDLKGIPPKQLLALQAAGQLDQLLGKKS